MNKNNLRRAMVMALIFIFSVFSAMAQRRTIPTEFIEGRIKLGGQLTVADDIVICGRANDYDIEYVDEYTVRTYFLNITCFGQSFDYINVWTKGNERTIVEIDLYARNERQPLLNEYKRLKETISYRLGGDQGTEYNSATNKDNSYERTIYWESDNVVLMANHLVAPTKEQAEKAREAGTSPDTSYWLSVIIANE